MSKAERRDVITMLEEAAAARRPLVIELRDGQHFCDGVCDVLHEYGEDFVVFHAHNRMLVRDIARAARTASGYDCEDIAHRESDAGSWAAL